MLAVAMTIACEMKVSIILDLIHRLIATTATIDSGATIWSIGVCIGMR